MQVPNLVQYMFPIAPHFVSYVLPNIAILQTVWVGVKIGIYRFFYVWNENFYIVEGLKFQNFCLWWANQRGSFTHKILDLECTPTK
jgi:hypothetical protein